MLYYIFIEVQKCSRNFYLLFYYALPSTLTRGSIVHGISWLYLFNFYTDFYYCTTHL